jgi:phenylalanyl-tRNA synthetase beta chain
MTNEFIESTLQSLNFKLERKGKDVWVVTCPTFRADMELEADLIEELARFHGYQNIPATLPPSKVVGNHSPIYRIENAVRGIMLGLGYSEAVNLSFAYESDHSEFRMPRSERVAIRNPLTEDTQFMRATLAPGLVRSAKRNFNYDQRIVRLFEIGKVYRAGPDGSPQERNILGILGAGGFTDQNWKNPAAGFDFFHLRGTVEALLRSVKVPSYEVESTNEISWLNATDAAMLKIGEEMAGVLGSLSASLEEKYKLRQPVYLAEIEFDCVARHAFAPFSCQALPKYPSSERDISIVISRDLSYKTIHGDLMGLQIPELVAMSLIDVYEGEKIPPGKVSLTLRLTFQDREKTLTVDRVQAFVDTILSRLSRNYAAGLRSI